jgi:D-aminopeptidase
MNRRRFMGTTLGGLSLWPLTGLIQEITTSPRLQERVKDEPRKRLRELGIRIGTLETGPHNALTDVEGVRVGQTTIIKGEGKGAARTGVTVILPHSGNVYEENLWASAFNLNGWGEMTGVAPIENTGLLRTPIFLTGTYNVGIVYGAAMEYLSRLNPRMGVTEETACPVVAECFDDFLSDTPSRPINTDDVFNALDGAKPGPVAEGAVGGGTGMMAFGFKGGIGTSSRRTGDNDTVGVLVMANTASRSELRIDGVPVGRKIKGFNPQPGKTRSIILVAATDAPLLPFQLKKIAKRVALGLAQAGATSHTGSGDIILAFSTADRIPRDKQAPFRDVRSVSDFWITPLYQAAVEATQEAILNALTMAGTIVGRDGNTAYGIPLDQVRRIMMKFSSID